MKCQTAIRPQPRSSMKSTTEITYESETCYGHESETCHGKQHVTMSNGYKDTTDSLMKEKHAKIRSV